QAGVVLEARAGAAEAHATCITCSEEELSCCMDVREVQLGREIGPRHRVPCEVHDDVGANSCDRLPHSGRVEEIDFVTCGLDLQLVDAPPVLPASIEEMHVRITKMDCCARSKKTRTSGDQNTHWSLILSGPVVRNLVRVRVEAVAAG